MIPARPVALPLAQALFPESEMVQVVVPNYIAAGKSNLSRYSPAQNVTCRLGMHGDHGREGAPARLLSRPLLILMSVTSPPNQRSQCGLPSFA
jgi:hypothetical protein